MTQMRGANNPLDRVGGWPDTAAVDGRVGSGSDDDHRRKVILPMMDSSREVVPN
jgi:hypothetical protein